MREMLESLVNYYYKIYDKDKINVDVYKSAIILIGDILENMDEKVDDTFKVYFCEVANRILEIPVEDVDRGYVMDLANEVANIIYVPQDISEVLRNSMLPKIDFSLGMGNVFYRNLDELRIDLQKCLVKRSNVLARFRKKVYGYVYIIASDILYQVDLFGIKPQDYDEELILWMLRQVLKTPVFKESYEAMNDQNILTKQRKEALYLKLVHN